ncbi:MAG: HAD hydrolase-like protein, partial [Nanoarchaeota archaeon]
MKIKLLIFDFDGTIADSKAVYYNVMNRYLESYGFTRKEIDKSIDVGLSVAETLKKLGFSSIFSWFIKRRIIKEVLRHASEIKKCKDVDSI